MLARLGHFASAEFAQAAGQPPPQPKGFDPVKAVRDLLPKYMNTSAEIAPTVPLAKFVLAKNLSAQDLGDFQKFVDIGVGQGVVKGAVDVKTIETCSSGEEGKKLLAASFALASSLDITGSPTFLSNNKRTFNAIAAPDVQKQFCQDNAGLKGCSGVIQEDASAAKPVDPAQCGSPK